MPKLNDETTRILLALVKGDREHADELLPVIYDELRRIAGNYMHGERSDHTLQPTELVHEAFLRLRKIDQIGWSGRTHFCAISAHIMRQILVDHARRKKTGKRGAHVNHFPLDERIGAMMDGVKLDLLDLNSALDELAELNPRHGQVVEMRFFAGLSVEETASVLEVSPSTVKRDWRMARAWLLTQVGSD